MRPATRPDPCFDALERLRAAGFKLTAQRRAIVAALVGDRSHPTAQELFERLQAREPAVSFATVYNTLATLTEVGVCVARPLTAGSLRYDPTVVPHDHAVCHGCGAVFDVPSASSQARPTPKDEGPEAAVDGFSVSSVERVFRGRCRACAAAIPSGR